MEPLNDEKEKKTLTDIAAEKIKYNTKYVIFLVVILGLAHVLDEYSTLAPGMYQSSMIREFFVNTGWMDYQEALGFMERLAIVSIGLMLFGNFYKGLSDRIGRKRVFIISAIGMVLGNIIMILSGNYWIYFIGATILSFFILTDVQYQFINEETPSKFRAQAFSYAKILGLLGLLLVPLIRSRTITEESENWRPILYVPLIIGIVVIVGSLLFLKEPRAYRILQEERKLNPDAFKEDKINLREAFKYIKSIPAWSQIKWLFLVRILVTPFSMLNQRYTDSFMDQVQVPHDGRNLVLTISTISVGVAYLLQGIFSDKRGRKPALIVNNIAVLLLVPLEFIAMLRGNLIMAGIAQGLRIGAFWNVTDTSRFMIIENTPTKYRGSVQAIAGLLQFSIIIPALLINSFLLEAFPYVQWVLVAIGTPITLFIIIIALLKLKETKDNDITKL